jgi:hypothetical protein
MTEMPRGLRIARYAARQLVPRHDMATALEGIGEQLANAADLIACGRTAEGRLALDDARRDIDALRGRLAGESHLSV